MRWCLCGRSRCLEDVSGYTLSVKGDDRHKRVRHICAAREQHPQLKLETHWGVLPNASGDTWGFWGTWGRIHRGRGWAMWWAPVGTVRSTRVLTCDVLALYTRCSSSGWQCRHGYGRTPDCPSCGEQMGCHPNCPENPGSRQRGH